MVPKAVSDGRMWLAGGEGVAVEAVHRPGGAQIAAVASLIERTSVHDVHRPIGEHALVELKEGPKAFPHAAFLGRLRGYLAGYAHLSERETRSGWRLEAFTAPEFRGHGVGTALLGAVLDHVRSHGGGRFHAWAYRPGPAQQRLAERFGMRATRVLVHMTRPLPGPDLALPDGYSIAPFRRRDGREWIAVHNEVFSAHPDGGNWREADLRWHLREPWFDASGFLLAHDGSGLAGYCWMKLDGDAGWVYFLGTHPRARGSGLAPALCAAGLRWAEERGAVHSRLCVDEANRPATRLYATLGFKTDHTDLCYAIEVPRTSAGEDMQELEGC